MASRIKNLPIAEKASDDDYLAIDGATNNSRKILTTSVGGGMIDFESSLTPSMDSRGVYYTAFIVVPTDTSVLTNANLLKIELYLKNSTTYNYPLIVISGIAQPGNSRFVLNAKSIDASVQSTSSTTVSGTLHVVAPFEISSVSYFK